MHLHCLLSSAAAGVPPVTTSRIPDVPYSGTINTTTHVPCTRPSSSFGCIYAYLYFPMLYEPTLALRSQ